MAVAELGLRRARDLDAGQDAWVNTCVNGIGERAGNADLVSCILAFRFGFGVGETVTIGDPVDLSWARRFGLWAAYAFGQQLPPAWPGVGRNAFAHESGIHADGALKDRGNYELYDDAELGPFPADWFTRQGRVVLTGEYGGKAGLRHVLEGLGIAVAPGRGRPGVLPGPAVRVRDRQPLTDDELRLIAGYPARAGPAVPGDDLTADRRAPRLRRGCPLSGSSNHPREASTSHWRWTASASDVTRGAQSTLGALITRPGAARGGTLAEGRRGRRARLGRREAGRGRPGRAGHGAHPFGLYVLEVVKVFISFDMEGVAGIVDWSQCRPPGQPYEEGRRLLLGEVNAAIDGALAAGATDIVCNDSHGTMNNLDPAGLHGQATYVSGRHKPLYMMQGLDSSADVIFMVGYHGSISGESSVLSHTYNPAVISHVELNGARVGESGINALVALAFGVPVGLITGDRQTDRRG